MGFEIFDDESDYSNESAKQGAIRKLGHSALFGKNDII